MGEFEILDTDEPLPKRLERHAFDRLIMLSDGVFAIAITLATLELRPPEHWDGTSAAFWSAMSYPLLTYVVSFAAIGGFWAGHRRMLARLRRVNAAFTALNLLLLGWVALIPATTALMSSHVQTRFTTDVYAGVMIATGLTQMAAWAYAAFGGRLVAAEAPMKLRVAVLVSMSFVPLLFAVVAWRGWPHGGGEFVGFMALLLLVAVARRLALRRLGA